MRADAQAQVDRIDAALNLVKMSLDWDRALRRLDELNARVEDPTLWDNPKKAEEVMRERRRLDAAISTVKEIDADKTGTVELIELAEMEGDETLANEGAASLKELALELEVLINANNQELLEVSLAFDEYTIAGPLR